LSNTTSAKPTELARDAKISIRAATRLAWSLWAVCVVLIALSLVFDFLTDDGPPFRPMSD
jgi:hypothetical protein